MLRHPVAALSDGVITLRAKRQDDVDAITEACQDPSIQTWTLVPKPYSRDDAVAWLEHSARATEEGHSIDFLVVDADDRLLGSVGLMEIDRVACSGEIGYWVSGPARGRGFAARAVALLRDWAHEELGLRRIEILVHRDNLVSRRVAQRAGFADTGERRPQPRVEGTTEPDHVVYGWRGPSAA